MDESNANDSDAIRRDPHSLVGKTVLIGITRLDHHDELIEKTEKFGRIASVDPDDGIKVDVGERELFTLPPNPEHFIDARPGIYRLRSTGETVEDPDLTTIWTIKEPPPA
jgi:hypothetical protein